MEAIIMDQAFRMIRLVDVFSSFIWNVQYCGHGDFELRYPMDVGGLASIQDGNYVSIKESTRYMTIEHVEIKTDPQLGNYAVVSGRSLEAMLIRHVIRQDTLINGSLQDGIMRILNENIIDPADPKRRMDRIGFLASTDLRITALKVEAEFKAGDNIYDSICALCESFHLGWRMVPREGGLMLFELFMGEDRSYAQNKNPWVVFSSKFENLKDTSMVVDTQNLVNCAIVESKWTTSVTDPSGEVIETQHSREVEVDLSEGNMDRREIYVSSREIPEEVDKAQFGKAEYRVNKMQFCTWEVVKFDRDAYNEAISKWNDKHARLLDNRKGATKEWQKLDPSDPRYDPSVDEWEKETGRNLDWLHINWIQVDVPGETIAEWQERNKGALENLHNSHPQEEDFYEYGWVLTDFAGYNAALEKAQAEIDAEYAAAVKAAEDFSDSVMRQEGIEALAPYLTISSFEGNVDTNVQYHYNQDYYLGDLVQIVNEYGIQAATRVTGMLISVEEGQGRQEIPSFTSDDKAVFEI